MKVMDKVVDDMFLSVLKSMDAEKAHDLSVRTLARGMGPTLPPPDHPALGVTVWGKRFINPLGLAAGYDKNALVPDACLRMGFGHVEVGGVTPRAQEGNDPPRLFRLPEDGAIINRMGLNNEGMVVVYQRLAKRVRYDDRGFVGVNLAKNADTPNDRAASDYATLAALLHPYCDFMVLNLSSPNTEGLCELQDPASLRAIIRRVRAATPDDAPPLLLKMSPDLTEAQMDDLAGVAVEPENPLDGIICVNTTTTRPEGLRNPIKDQPGGLSGMPIKALSLARLRSMADRLYGRVPLVSVGGVDCAADVIERLRAGASLVQLYTALAYCGHRLIPLIKTDLIKAMREQDIGSIEEIIGADLRGQAA
ncbi:quinone-dependent dihydroorotate dehydrogenase [Roseospira visakhapatnamensis]|uniref:Dihydroorotate dehydrogenase (quinone) n=1 Tax=Roseospira visakhapatnamensis TaxID=390880 RepID=A0A7W6RCJ6_9PROT|nr:quinone-dependent dihydroorotate dehydrogenase [Roseospira visakhapatnamensis]MBB4265651.1 dihydroorotate dehydrogenase [Roseospira visakhapatnamensis]